MGWATGAESMKRSDFSLEDVLYDHQIGSADSPWRVSRQFEAKGLDFSDRMDFGFNFLYTSPGLFWAFDALSSSVEP